MKPKIVPTCLPVSGSALDIGHTYCGDCGNQINLLHATAQEDIDEVMRMHRVHCPGNKKYPEYEPEDERHLGSLWTEG